MKLIGLFIVLLSLLLTQTCCREQPYRLIIHTTDLNAKCLDGSPPPLYIHQGGDRSKLLIFFYGFGLCSGYSIGQIIQSCYGWSKTQMGSSKYNWPTFTSSGGYLSTDPTQSRFATWTKIIIWYCDGTLHQGHNDDPISYKDTLLYFRGSDNTRSHFKWLQLNYQLSDAEKVVLTGDSVGGMASIYWSNYMRGLLNNPDSLYVISDSGIFVNATLPGQPPYKVDMLGNLLYKVANLDEKSPIPACNLKYPGEEYKCLYVQYSYQFLQHKILFLNSEYDRAGLQIVFDFKCIRWGETGYTFKYCNKTQLGYIQGYRDQYMKTARILIQNGHSVWAMACCKHSFACYQARYNDQDVKVPMLVGDTVEDSINRFVFGGQRVIRVDEEPWPSNQPCAY